MNRPRAGFPAPQGPALLLLLAVAACHSTEDELFAFAEADPARHTVLVEDDGFDLRDTAFDAKVIAAYLIYCAPPEGRSASAPGRPTFEQAKQLFLEDMQRADESCFLAQGMYLQKSRSFEGIGPYRERWNRSIESGSFQAEFPDLKQAEQIAAVLDGEDRYSYHGTYTSGLIAVDNPKVQLVFIQKPMSSVQAIVSGYTCLDPEAFALDLQILSDPQAQKAYVERPLSRLERDVNAVIDRHQIGLVNHSFGTLSRATLERLQADNDCPAVDLAKLFELQNGLLKQKEQYRKQAGLSASHPHLTIQAAGNDGATVNTLADSRECSGIQPDTLVVGAVDKDRNPAPFTNLGACVDVYTLGVDVIVPAPEDFSYVVSGTSFSVPFLVRALTLSHSPGEPLDQLRQALVSGLDLHRVFWDAGLVDQFLYRAAGTKQKGALPLRVSSQPLLFDPPLLLTRPARARSPST